MRYEEIEPHLIDFLKGKTDEATEYRIKDYLQKNPEFQSELDALKDTLFFVKKAPLADVKPHLKMDFYAMLSEAQKNQKSKKSFQIWLENVKLWWTMPKFKVAFAMGFTLTAITLWFAVSQKNIQKNSEIANKNQQETQKVLPKNIDTKKVKTDKKPKSIDDVYVDNNKTIQPIETKSATASNMGEPMMSDMAMKMEEKSYSRVVNKDNYAPLDTDKVKKIYEKNVNLKDYLSYIKNNENVHQQLAALSELEKYAHLEEVRTQVLAQLPYIKNTHLQLATVDWIVKNNILEGALPLNRLLEQELHPVVRDCVEDALESM